MCIHVPSEIQTHNLSVWVVKTVRASRLLGRCDRHVRWHSDTPWSTSRLEKLWDTRLVEQFAAFELNIHCHFLFLLFFFNMYRASFVVLYNEPTNAQLIDKIFYCFYMFRHYCVILRELVTSTLLSYTSMWHWQYNLKFHTSLCCSISMFKISKILKLPYL